LGAVLGVERGLSGIYVGCRKSKELIYAGKVDHGFFYSAAPPLENSGYRFENVALAATGEVGLFGNALLPRGSVRLRQ
jgi:hypothetical protein